MARAIDCKTCLHEKVCDLWLQQERQDASCFCLDGCDYFDPTLTPPNEPLTLEELKAEAKRHGYRLIKSDRPRFERCLCGHNVHQWVSGPEGWKVYCKHCGLESPWAKKSHSAVIAAWNAMILEKRKEQNHEDV